MGGTTGYGCVLGDTRTKGQGGLVRRGTFRGLVDPLDAVDTGDASDIDEDGFQLALVGNFQAGFDASIQVVRTACQIANIGAGTTDDCGDFGQQPGAIFGFDGKLHRECRGAIAAPLNGDAAFRLVQKILHVRTTLGVDRNAAAAGNVTDDF